MTQHETKRDVKLKSNCPLCAAPHCCYVVCVYVSEVSLGGSFLSLQLGILTWMTVLSSVKCSIMTDTVSGIMGIVGCLTHARG